MPLKPATGLGAGSGVGAGVGANTVGVVNPLCDMFGVVGAGETGVGLFAASKAFAFKSLSPPANIIPDNVPVKNVAIVIIISKNFWSIGLIAFNG